MLKVDDRFKCWLRFRLKDKAYAEKFVKCTTELEDIEIKEIWPHAALPYESEDDPEAMIGMIKAHDNKDDSDFIVGIFGDYEYARIIMYVYSRLFWEPYHPETNADFDNLPMIYKIAFADSDSEEELLHCRWTEKNDSVPVEVLAKMFGEKINVVNTRNDTDLIRKITGKDKIEETDKENAENQGNA
ncbi:MAG: hypothetical protein IKN85_06625 [Oscillospiraceae bacterium]|nr:hypothetical protein [Oscillospiraceae bacterium]MBR3535484.1 hypothetical protein [Oscillospiraceae bacterium]MBR6834941.1 hypothetical protein [Oscillospiraceae bacterium]